MKKDLPPTRIVPYNPYQWAVAMVFSIVFALISIACGNLAEDSDGEAVKKDVEVNKSVSAGSATTLAIESGSATGTEVSVPDGALSSGTELSLDRVEQPSEFAGVASDSGDGDGTFATASSAVNITGTKDGSDVSPSSPMTLSIPYSGTNLTLNLAGVSKSSTNLCVILKTKADKLFVFRNKLLSIDTTAKKVKFKSLFFGIYQVIFCGTQELTNFEDAGEEGVAAPPPDSDPNTFSSFGKEVSYQLTVDGSTHHFDASQFCLGILTETSGQDSDATIIAGSSFTVSRSSMTLSLTVDTSLISNESKVFVALLAQSSSESCSWNPGDVISTTPDFRRAFLFHTTKKAVHNEQINGTLGSGMYALRKKTIVMGAPSGSNATTATPFAVSKGCVDVEIEDSSENGVASSYSNISVTASPGEQFDIWSPVAGEGQSGGELKIRFGLSCQDEGSTDHSASYNLFPKTAASDGNYYIVPISLELSESTKTKKALLGSSVGDLCVELYPGTYTDSSSTASADGRQALGKWKLTGDSLTTYVPWDTSKTNNNIPVYDALFHVGSNCQSGYPSSIIIPENDKVMLSN